MEHVSASRVRAGEDEPVDPGLAHIRDQLLRRTGHHYYLDKQQVLEERLRERMRLRDIETVEAYSVLLGDPATGEAEWRALEDAITIGETYFFRYAEQFEELRSEILPRLIAARSDRKTLRIWSIGCSNGAEPYTIAIILREVLGKDIDSWRISITGGDISEAALKRAAAGRFGQWALRALSTKMIERYFDVVGPRTWLLKTPYRAMVRFERQNLLSLLTPAAPLQWNEFDVIFCRNVLIYFSPDVAVRLVDELKARLADGGRLVLGHAEAGLTAPLPEFAETGLPTEFQTALSPVAAPVPFPANDAVPLAPWMPLEVEAPAPAADAPDPNPAIVSPAAKDTLDELLALLRRLADEGDYRAANEVSARLLARRDAPPVAFYLRAILRQVDNDTVGAELALKQAIYLDREFVLAHHRIGLLAMGAGRAANGRRSMRTAVRLASQLPPETELTGGDGLKAGEFVLLAGAQLDAGARS